ncbi:MAG: hypothetical protein ABSF88_01315 [Candidatus Aminicenantales bacterium]
MGKKASELIFLVISWLFGIYLLVIFHIERGFPPRIFPFNWEWLIIGIAIVLFLLPFVSKIKIGNIIEFEREVKRMKESISEFKMETRQTLSLISSSIRNIQNINLYNVPKLDDIKVADGEVERLLSPDKSSEAQNIRNELLDAEEDNIMILARIRIMLEQSLRKILGKKLEDRRIGEKEVKYLTARQLFDRFIIEYPEYIKMKEGFDYVIRICNAAIHGQRIPEDEANAAIDMSSRLIAVLKDPAGEHSL